MEPCTKERSYAWKWLVARKIKDLAMLVGDLGTGLEIVLTQSLVTKRGALLAAKLVIWPVIVLTKIVLVVVVVKNLVGETEIETEIVTEIVIITETGMHTLALTVVMMTILDRTETLVTNTTRQATPVITIVGLVLDLPIQDIIDLPLPVVVPHLLEDVIDLLLAEDPEVLLVIEAHHDQANILSVLEVLLVLLVWVAVAAAVVVVVDLGAVVVDPFIAP